MNPTGRSSSPTARLIRFGFHEVARAEAILGEEWFARVCPSGDQADDGDALLSQIGAVADSDLALLALSRMHAAAGAPIKATLEAVLREGGEPRRRLLAVLGNSTALADQLVAHPEDLEVIAGDSAAGVLAESAEVTRAILLRAAGADPEADVPRSDLPRDRASSAVDAMRRAYRRELLRVAAADLTSQSALDALPEVAAKLADLAAGALDAGLAIARAIVPDSERVRLAVLGMGKTGGRELNYISDVDVIFVAEGVPSPEVGEKAEGELASAGEHLSAQEELPEEAMLRVATKLATETARACSGHSLEPALWEVDAALRPEGKQGPLVRTLASHVAYYKRWAKTWEFQALLKARPVAGDAALGQAYVEALNPMVWVAVQRDHFVEDTQAMRRRVEAHIPRREADRELKLGAGGLRDVEFTVQLLQLVHGRLDEEIHQRNTLAALAALAQEGFVGRVDASRLGTCYRFLRLLEHRIQLYRMRRTHLMPIAEADLTRLARSLGVAAEDGRSAAEELTVRWLHTRRDVRKLHEELYYRPLLPATAQLSADEASLAPEAARARLAALGYRAPEAALKHIAALTEGVSRRAAIQRQLLPVMLGWFTDGPDPDGGLLAFRTLSEDLGGTHWYLKLLRDSGVAAHNLARVLSSSKYAAEALRRSPESVQWLAEDGDLASRATATLTSEMDAVLARRAGETDSSATYVRFVRRRELGRAAVADVLGHLENDPAPGISYAADAALQATLRIATAAQCEEEGRSEPPTAQLIVAMGRLGGHELGYASDADVMFVHDPLPGKDVDDAQRFALAVAQSVGKLLGTTGPEPALEVDATLRPEGRNGPLTRTFAAYEEYYSRWSAGWERQALLRARPVAGDEDLAVRFIHLIDPIRYAGGGLSEQSLRDYRRIKARVENERLPRGITPNRHLKLGPGGIADVEWTVQLLQLLHAHDVPSLRTPHTLDALHAASGAGLITPLDERRLCDAWRLAMRTRDAIVLVTGRVVGSKVDVLPSERRELAGVAHLLGYGPHGGAQLEEDYLRMARRARAVVKRLFFGE